MEAPVAAQHVGVLDDPGALGLGDLARPVGRRGVDDEDLVEERHPADHLADRPPDDRADRLLLVEGRQDEADRQALLLLELGQPAQVGELVVVEVRLAEPALDAGRHGARFLRGAVGGGQGLGVGRQLLERLAPDRLAGLHDDDGRLRARGDRLRHRAEQVGRAVDRGRRGGAHDHDVRVVGLAQDRGPDVRGLADERVDRALDVLPHERGQRALGLGADGERDPGRDDVERGERRAVALRDRARDVERQLGVRAAADRHHDALEVADAALLDDGDVARRLAQDLVDRRRERRRERPRALGLAAGDLPPQPKTMRSASSSAATSTMPSAACRPMRTIGWMRVPSGTKSRTRWSSRRACRARVAPSDRGMPSGTSTMPERGQLAAARVEEVGAEPDELLRGRRDSRPG